MRLQGARKPIRSICTYYPSPDFRFDLIPSRPFTDCVIQFTDPMDYLTYFLKIFLVCDTNYITFAE
jgi:hypothetical protein